MRYEARAPLRVDFAGGWTDVPLFATREGGAVLNAAITRYVRGYIARPDGIGPLRALRSDRSYLSYSLDLPAGAGLGASAAQTVLWVTLFRTTVANTAGRREVAAIACEVAGALGIMGGKQDEYASALGGINFLTFNDAVGVERLDLEPSFLAHLRSHLVLVYTGESRLSSAVHAAVWERYRAGDADTVGALRELKRTAHEMKSAAAAGDHTAFGALMAENWTAQKALHPSVSTERIDRLLEQARRSGAVSGKALGAGGGGCTLLLAASGQTQQVRESVAQMGLQIIDFDFDTYGVFLSKG